MENVGDLSKADDKQLARGAKRQRKQLPAQKMIDHIAEVCSAMMSVRTDEDFRPESATEVDAS